MTMPLRAAHDPWRLARFARTICILTGCGQCSQGTLACGVRAMFRTGRARSLIACAFLIVNSGLTMAQDSSPPLSWERLACMGWGELQSLYRDAQPGSLPAGFVRGRSLFNPCEKLAGSRTKVANCLWRGKHFCPEDCTLVNQWLGVRAIRAHTYAGESWHDGKPALILDYADSSFVWRKARDEMREVAPGLYVGMMHIRDCPQPRIKTMFILQATCAQH